MDLNGFSEAELETLSDTEIGLAFQRASLPPTILGDLRVISEKAGRPLALRSSSLLEDAMFRPFAGVYETKMTPNNQPDPEVRYRKLLEAVKFVYASCFMAGARAYRGTLPEAAGEKMAIVIQGVVGEGRGDRFYPLISGVARSFNYYPPGDADRSEGVVELALGLGKSIVDDAAGYSYLPTRPRRPPLAGSVGDLLDLSQRQFWAVNMGTPPAFDPAAEDEYLVRCDLEDADYDNTLRHVASTVEAGSDRITPGTGRPGARLVNFGPLLGGDALLNRAVSRILDACKDAVGDDVEIEFAAETQGASSGEVHLTLLQVRPMVAAGATVSLEEADLTHESVLLASRRIVGDGVIEGIRDVVYVKPAGFDFSRTRDIAQELTRLNAGLVKANRPYLLLGFGRWGSSDPWLGIPVAWSSVAGARAIVEATVSERVVEPSQGSHFFHNLISFQVPYFHIGPGEDPGIRWDRLDACRAEFETDHLRHIEFPVPLRVEADGRAGWGRILAGAE